MPELAGKAIVALKESDREAIQQRISSLEALLDQARQDQMLIERYMTLKHTYQDMQKMLDRYRRGEI